MKHRPVGPLQAATVALGKIPRGDSRIKSVRSGRVVGLATFRKIVAAWGANGMTAAQIEAAYLPAVRELIRTTVAETQDGDHPFRPRAA